jgi:AcrR family transcriptional regulator
MRAVAKTAGTTTPTVYERYRDRADILHALRLRMRHELIETLSRTRTMAESCERYLQFAMEHQHEYEVLFDAVAQPPSLHEPWPSFNLFRQRLAERLGGTPRDHTRLMLAIWSMLHGAAMLIIRGQFEGALQTQTIYSCIDAVEAIVNCVARAKIKHTGPKWPAKLILGEGRKRRGNHSRRRVNRRRDSRKLV